jgi:hypothetical protein
MQYVYVCVCMCTSMYMHVMYVCNTFFLATVTAQWLVVCARICTKNSDSISIKITCTYVLHVYACIYSEMHVHTCIYVLCIGISLDTRGCLKISEDIWVYPSISLSIPVYSLNQQLSRGLSRGLCLSWHWTRSLLYLTPGLRPTCTYLCVPGYTKKILFILGYPNIYFDILGYCDI